MLSAANNEIISVTHVPVFPDRSVREELIMSREVPKSESIARGLKCTCELMTRFVCCELT